MKAIVSLATKNGNYVNRLARLEESLKNNFDGDFFGFIGEHSVGAPRHIENPYAFKIYAINAVREQGYNQILWLDSSVFAIKNVQPVFDEIDKDGFIMQEAGHYVSDWCNDAALAYFKLLRQDARGMLMYGNAGFLGLDFNITIGREFFTAWEDSMKAGAFKGDWSDHRHDMSAGSIIANKLGMHKKYKSGNEWLQYAGPYDATANDTIIFKAQG